MQILLLDPDDGMLNFGEVAMFRVAAERLHRLHPQATMRVPTSAVERLAQNCPAATAMTLAGSGLWLQPWNLFGGVHRLLPASVTDSLHLLEEEIRARWPSLARRWIARRLRRRNLDPGPMGEFVEAVSSSALVVTSGAGFVTDSFRTRAVPILDTLRLAQHRRIPTAMLSQGFGPLSDPRLRRKAALVLPQLDLIGVREGGNSMPLLDALGVRRSRVLQTGDDSIEIAHQARATTLGSAIGVNLRVAPYSQLDLSHAAHLRGVLEQLAGRWSAPLLPLPVSRNAHDRDSDSLAQVVGGDGGLAIDTLDALLAQVARCKVVVTASYHAGVFALAQGIPVVALVATEYYRIKFAGLADQFDGGCQPVFVSEADWPQSLVAALTTAWADAEGRREALWRAARRQIEASQAAYERLAEIVRERWLGEHT
jgi:polysaccharide pyruvyl transferase WcaK-like protein